MRSSLVPEESKKLLWVQLLQQMQGTDRGGRNGGCSSDLRGLQLFQSVGEAEGMSPVRRFLSEDLENGRLEEEKRW